MTSRLNVVVTHVHNRVGRVLRENLLENVHVYHVEDSRVLHLVPVLLYFLPVPVGDENLGVVERVKLVYYPAGEIPQSDYRNSSHFFLRC